MIGLTKQYRKRFCIADLHFGHRNIINLAGRPFSSVEEMNEVLVNNWNKVVTKDDLVYLLGDVCLNMNKADLYETLHRLNGDIILVQGNHDKDISFKWWTERCQRFLFVSPYPIIVDGAFIMSHEPIYMNRNSPYYNIYGHVHDDERYPFYTPAGACVSVEKIEYTPVDIELIKMRVFRDHDINKFENLINK